MSPSNPDRPTRSRRFSALKPAVKRGKLRATAAHGGDDPSASEADPEIASEHPADGAGAPAAASSSSDPVQKASDMARVAKVMARAGLCSRRDAEAWIVAGRVAVNGATIDSPALNVGPDDAVTVDGYPIDRPERTRLFLFHKTRGLVTTAKDPEGRPTVFDALPPEMPRVVTIGRLDINTEGLLLLTNDGGLARMLELPSTGWIRRYRVRANGTTDQARLDALAKGITIDGVVYAGIAAKLDRVQGANLWLTMGLKEGRNREIKRVLEHLGLAVTRLIRISFGPFQLGELGDNAVEEVRTRVLRDQLGSALAKQAGLDFDGPVDLGHPEVGRNEAPAPAPARAAPQGKAPHGRPKADATTEGPRRKTRRSETADRRGRAVAVERIATAAARGERPSASHSAPVLRAGGVDRVRGKPSLRTGDPVRRDRSPDAEPDRFRSTDERLTTRRGPSRPGGHERDFEARPHRAGRLASGGRVRDAETGRSAPGERPARARPSYSRDKDDRVPRGDGRRDSRAERPRQSGKEASPAEPRRNEGGADGRARTRPVGKPGGRPGRAGPPKGGGRPPRR